MKLGTLCKILNVENESRCRHDNALIVQHYFTNYIQSYPMKTRNIGNNVVFTNFFSIKRVIKAISRSTRNHDTSTVRWTFWVALALSFSCTNQSRQKVFRYLFIYLYHRTSRHTPTTHTPHTLNTNIL